MYGNQRYDGNRGALRGLARGRFLAVLSLACSIGLTGAAPLLAADTGGNVNPPPPTAASGPAVNDPNYWVGRNISAVVKVFGQPTSWNANHDGGGGEAAFSIQNPASPTLYSKPHPGKG